MRTFWIAAFLGVFLFSGSASAQADGLKSDLLACKALEKDKKRLKCLDAVLSSIDEGTVLSDASDNVEQNPDDDFGAIDLAKEREKTRKTPKVLTASLVEIARNNRGKYVIILDNGQIWRQLRADTSRLLIPRNESGQEVTIKRRSLGAHTFSFASDKRSIRVERIK